MTPAGTWGKPFSGFRVLEMLFASVWLIFLLVPMGFALTSANFTTGRLIAGGSLTLLFIAVYLFYFGAGSYYPRTWSPLQRRVSALALLIAVAVAVSLFLGHLALSFFPFICAVVVFTFPMRQATPLVIGSTLLVTALSFVLLREQAVNFLGATLSPLFILGIGALSHKDDKNRDLQHRLDMTEERERIALDVHDVLGHSLTVINLKSELAKRLIEADPAKARAELDEISALSRTALAEVRSTVTHLRHPDLPGAFDATSRALSTAGISYSLPDNATTAGPNGPLFASVLKEATTNILRHSQASNVVVRVAADRLQIEDNGVGMAPGVEEKGNGLRGMKDRVAQAGGTAYIEDAPGGGTRVFVTMSGNQDRWE